MEDRLVWLLNYFELRARVFQAGPLCHSARYDEEDGVGYLHVLRSGALTLKTAGQPRVELKEPCLVFYMNPTGHHIQPAARGVDMVCASFDFGAGRGNPLGPALPDVLVLKLVDMPTLDTLLELLFQEASAQHCGRQAVLDRLSEVVIVQLLRDLMDRQRLEVGLFAALAQPKLARAINAIHAEPARPWTLEELSEVAGMSRARFAVRFRDTVGTTPGSYLTAWRMGIAQTLLRKGKSVQWVADEVGYASASALSRAFTAQLGLSPSDWKKRQS